MVGYDVFLDGQLVGDSGDMLFKDKNTATYDAKDFIKSLCEEYNKNENDFEISFWETNYYVEEEN